jgi:putative spermidine/putrescine transport system permease protein
VARSIALAAMITALTLVLSYPIAFFIHRAVSRWKGLLTIVAISPLLVSAVVRTYGWMVILGDQGLINGLLQFGGLIERPLRLINNTTGVVIGLVEILMPYMVLALMAGFGRLDRVYEEAAQSLGAGPWTTFRRIVLPLTVPGIALGCLLCFVLAISSFITPKLLGGGRVFLLATEIFDQAIVLLNWPLAATMSIVVLGIFGLALLVYGRLMPATE